MDAQPSPELLCLLGAVQTALPDRLALQREAVSTLLGQYFSDEPAQVLRATAGLFAARAGVQLDLAAGERVLRWLEAATHHLLIQSLPGYPPALAVIANPPPLVFVSGRPTMLASSQLAVVGSRRATAAGYQIAKSLSAELASAGLVITSGLASGIDAAAHRGALEVGGGTIAVFGSGIDVVYPFAHRKLAEQIEETGALVSEFPLGCKPARHSFPRRNRIISGLASGTLVVEAAMGSGSLITAREALEQGREVFAVPGSIMNPLSAGPHWLIRQGAGLVESADDILSELPHLVLSPLLKKSEKIEACQISPQAMAVLGACGFEPTSFDTLVMRSGLTPPELSSILTALEIQGWVRSDAGGTFVLLKSAPERA